jgi:BlaI family penicillinase repressor
MPRRTKPEQLTPLELEIMQVLWETGAAPVQTVRDRLAVSKKLAYTTVQTMLNVLLRKGKVKRSLVERAYHYRPAVTKQKAVANALQDMVQRLFGGSAEALVVSLMETKHLTPEALARLQEMTEDDDVER